MSGKGKIQTEVFRREGGNGDRDDSQQVGAGMKLIALDFETTGLDPQEGAEIIEIGASSFTLDGGLIETFSALCKPSKQISKRITKINGITNQDVESEPAAVVRWNEFLEWAGECQALVAHNAPFELKFIRRLYEDLGQEVPDLPMIDTLKLARRRIEGVKSYKLVDLVEHFDIELVNAHRAPDDAKATAELARVILNGYSNPKAAVKSNTKTATEMIRLAEDAAERKRMRQRRMDEFSEEVTIYVGELQESKGSSLLNALARFITTIVLIFLLFAALSFLL